MPNVPFIEKGNRAYALHDTATEFAAELSCPGNLTPEEWEQIAAYSLREIEFIDSNARLEPELKKCARYVLDFTLSAQGSLAAGLFSMTEAYNAHLGAPDKFDRTVMPLFLGVAIYGTHKAIRQRVIAIRQAYHYRKDPQSPAAQSNAILLRNRRHYFGKEFNYMDSSEDAL